MSRLAIILTLTFGIAIALGAAEKPAFATWNPLGPMRAEVDTLSLADLASVESVERQGGFAMGVWQERKPAGEVYDFGLGRSGPGIQCGKLGSYTVLTGPPTA